MCGYVLVAGSCLPQDQEQILQDMSRRIMHRGPEDETVYTDDSLAVAVRRLSPHGQGPLPLYSEDKSLVVFFMGEEAALTPLREQLARDGHAAEGYTALLEGYRLYKEEMFRRMQGLFSLVVWDKKAGRLFALRDPLGIWPLYLTSPAPGVLLAASEIKSFLAYPGFRKEVNPYVMRSYLTLQYAPGPETFFKGVFTLPPGSCLIWDGVHLRSETYWQPQFGPYTAAPQDEWAGTLDDAVHKAVDERRAAAGAVGSYLSGGVDSSYIAACLRPEKTFSVGFAHQEDPLFNETVYAKELSDQLGLQNISRMLSPEECFAALPDIQYYTDQPQANPSCVPLWFLAKLAKEHVDVVLSGEGADELFGGYHLYGDTPAMLRYKKLPRFLRHLAGRAAKNLPPFKGRNFLLKCSGDASLWFIGEADVFSAKEAQGFLRAPYREGPAPLEVMAPRYAAMKAEDELTQKQLLDLAYWMPYDINVKADRMTMAHSLELRAPLLAPEIVALAQKTPPAYRIAGTGSKVVFRRAAARALPDEWATRPKKGFPTPIRHWLREEAYYTQVKEAFSTAYAAEFFETPRILQLLEDHYTRKKDNGRKVWVVYMFLVWYKRYFLDEA